MRLDFAYWAHLALHEPKRFDKERQKLLENAIQRAPVHRRVALTARLWKTATERSRGPMPLTPATMVYEMMMDYLGIQNDRYVQFRVYHDEQAQSSVPRFRRGHTAAILKLVPRSGGK